jgi:hypothetical protein
MKKYILKGLFFSLFLSGLFVSCTKDKNEDYTLKDQTVTGNFTYVTKSMVPIQVDPVSQQPLSATIAMDGSATVTQMGLINFTTSFKFDFVTGKGSDFVTTYTGTSASDSFTSTGSSQRQQDGSIFLTETFSNGKGRFSKMKGSGTTIVNISADQSGGTGAATWRVTY